MIRMDVHFRSFFERCKGHIKRLYVKACGRGSPSYPFLIGTTCIHAALAFWVSRSYGNETSCASSLSGTQDSSEVLFQNETDKSNRKIHSFDRMKDELRLSIVEIPVRANSFAMVQGQSSVFDLYYSTPGARGKFRTELLYSTLSIDFIGEGSDLVQIAVPQDDVALLLTLEMHGEYQLVANQSGKVSHAFDSIQPLIERDWVRAMLELNSVEVIQ